MSVLDLWHCFINTAYQKLCNRCNLVNDIIIIATINQYLFKSGYWRAWIYNFKRHLNTIIQASVRSINKTIADQNTQRNNSSFSIHRVVIYFLPTRSFIYSLAVQLSLLRNVPSGEMRRLCLQFTRSTSSLCKELRHIFDCHTVSFFRRYFNHKDKILFSFISRYLGEIRKLNYFSFSKRNSNKMSKVEINIAFSYLFHDKLLIAVWREVS